MSTGCYYFATKLCLTVISLDSLRDEFMLPIECYLHLELLAFTLVY